MSLMWTVAGAYRCRWLLCFDLPVVIVTWMVSNWCCCINNWRIGLAIAGLHKSPLNCTHLPHYLPVGCTRFSPCCSGPRLPVQNASAECWVHTSQCVPSMFAPALETSSVMTVWQRLGKSCNNSTPRLWWDVAVISFFHGKESWSVCRCIFIQRKYEWSVRLLMTSLFKGSSYDK